jgi:hypothetical protein
VVLTQVQIDYVNQFMDADGHIDPDELTAAAHNPNSPIYSLYEWNADRAAEYAWRDTSRRIIRFIRMPVVVSRQTVMYPKYVVDPQRPPRSHRYIEIDSARNDVDLARRILLDEMHRINQAIQRALAVAAALGLTQQLQQMLTNVSTIQQAAQQRQQQRQTRGRQPRRPRQTRGQQPRRPRQARGQPRKSKAPRSQSRGKT